MVTISDVARQAGVSISTVSYALSGKRSISAEARRRIDDAITELGYRPNAGARMLAGSRTRIFALTAPYRSDSYAPAHMEFVLAVATAMRAYDYDVLLLTADEATEGLRRVSSSRLIDGIIVLDVAIDDDRVALVRELGLPSVVVGVPGDAAGLVCVDLDFEAAARIAVDRLADLGHESICLLGNTPGVYDRGSNYPVRFRDALLRRAAERGLAARFEMPTKEVAGVRACVDRALDGPDRATGLVLQCEESVHTTALQALADRGTSVPADMSVISAGSTYATTMDAIPLVAADTCGRAAELAAAQLAGAVEPRVELVPPRYVDRGSTARPPAGGC